MTVLRFLCLFLVFSFTYIEASHARQDTPRNILKSKTYRTLDKLSAEKNYVFMMQNINARLNSTYSSRKDLNAVMFWLRDKYLFKQGDPKFGLSYVQFLESLARNFKNENPAQSKTIKQNSIIHFFVAEHLILVDLAKCADKTAGTNTRRDLDQHRQNYVNGFMALKPEDKKHVYQSIFKFIDLQVNRPAFTDICKSGQTHMQKAIELNKTTNKFTNKDDESTIYIDDDIAPDLVDDMQWKKRKNGLYNALQKDLLALQ